MRRYLMPVLCCLMACFTQISFANPMERPQLQWLTNYQEAVNLSRANRKPLLLFFTGSDWCGWCTRLEEEVFNKREFAEAIGDKFILVKLDFPLNSPIDPRTSNQNKQLQRQYDVRSFPTVIVIDSQGNRMGSTGYRAGGPRPFASFLLKMVGDYQAYQQKVQKLNDHSYTGTELKSLFEKASELELYEDANSIVKAGLKSNEKEFFQIEHYRQLVYEGRINSPEAMVLKQQLLASDPKNEHLTHYQVAVIDFEAYSEEMEKENFAPEVVVAPLTNYIEKFGNLDKENIWRLNMIISQVYLDKHQLPQALKFAQSSLDSAPPSVRPEIATAIKNIKAQGSPR